MSEDAKATPAPEPAKKPTKPREARTPYISNKEFTAEIIACKKKGELSKRAVEFFTLLADRTINRLTYENPLDREDCVQAALLDLCKYWKNFDPALSNNAFAYYTQFVKNGYAKQFKDLHPTFPKDKDGKRQKVKFVSLNNQGDNEIYSI